MMLSHCSSFFYSYSHSINAPFSAGRLCDQCCLFMRHPLDAKTIKHLEFYALEVKFFFLISKNVFSNKSFLSKIFFLKKKQLFANYNFYVKLFIQVLIVQIYLAHCIFFNKTKKIDKRRYQETLSQYCTQCCHRG